MEIFAYAFVAVPYLLAMLIAFGIAVAVWALATGPVTGVTLILITSCLDALFYKLPLLTLGINVFFDDLVSVLLSFALLIRFRRYPWRSLVGRLWVIFGAFMFVSFFIGAVKFGTAAGNDLRGYFFYFWVAAAYLMTFELTTAQLQRIRNVIVGAAIFMLILTCMRWGASVVGMDFGVLRPTTTGKQYLRVIRAGEAAIIAVGALLLLHRWLGREGGFTAAALAMVMLLAVVVLQHRTVWVQTMVGLMVLAAFHRERLGRGGGAVFWPLMLMAAIVVPLIVLGVGGGVQESVAGSVEEVGTPRGSFISRADGWRHLLAQWSSEGIRNYIVGQPFGSGYVREQQGSIVAWSPHNYYVHLLMRTGVFGAAAAIMAFVVTARRLVAARGGAHARWIPVLLSLLMLELTFFVTYSALFEQGIYCGIAFALAARTAPRSLANSQIDAHAGIAVSRSGHAMQTGTR